MVSTNRKITINATSAIVQVVFTAVLYFFLYKYMLDRLGAELLGVWSLILSFSSIANLANLGLTSGLVKFVAEYIAEGRKSGIGSLIFTSLLSLSGLFAVAVAIIFFLAAGLLRFVVDEKFLDAAMAILPYSLASLFINTISGVFTSTLEGFQKNYLRNFLYIFSGVAFFAGVTLLTPRFQLTGVAMAQLIQSGVVFGGAFLLMHRISTHNRITHWRWDRRTFKELFGYGYKMQLVSVAQLLYEPCTKFLLSRFGGLAFLGHYEMASRLVNQFRALLVNANQVVIPVVAHTAKTKTKADLQDFYRKMNRVLFTLTVPLSTALLITTPFISSVWIGYPDSDFIFATVALTLSAAVNIMCGPSYFSCMAEGRLSILVAVHVGMAVVNVVLGYALGMFFAGYGVFIAWSVALSAGSTAIIAAYSKELSVDYIGIFSKNDRTLLLLSALVLALGAGIYFIGGKSGMWMQIAAYGAVLALYVPAMLKNDIVKKLVSRS